MNENISIALLDNKNIKDTRQMNRVMLFMYLMGAIGGTYIYDGLLTTPIKKTHIQGSRLERPTSRMV
jgi:hypothetical protein